MSEDEDEELQALRSAALASLNKPRARRKAGEDLDGLRQAALQSRKASEDDDSIFEKLQPPKISNLINLTPEPNADLSAKPKNKFNRRNSEESVSASESESSLSDNNSGSSDSGSSSGEQSDSSESDAQEEAKNESHTEGKNELPKVEEEAKKDDDGDDILNAIDQFLGGDFEIPETKPPTPKAKTPPVEKKRKPKVKKKTKKKVKNKNIKQDKEETLQVQKAVTDSEVRKQKMDTKPVEKEMDRQRVPISFPTRSSPKHQEFNENSGVKKRKPASIGNDSVHSSDLSFLTDSSGDEMRADKNEDERSAPETAPNNRIPKNESLAKGASAGGTTTLPKKSLVNPDRKPVDLRKKLEGRGLPRNHGKDKQNQLKPTAKRKDDEQRRGGKIYMKPSLASKVNNERKQDSSAAAAKDDKDKIVITRNIKNERFERKSVKLKSDAGNNAMKKETLSQENGKQKTRNERKRSVLHFAPHTTSSERKEKIAELMKSAPKLTRKHEEPQEGNEEKSFSDISDQDFDAFEIAEDFDTEIGASNDANSDNKYDDTPLEHPTDTRVFITSSQTLDNSSSSGEIEKSPQQPIPPQDKKPQRRPVKERLSVRIKSVERNADFLRMQVDARTMLSRRSRKKRRKRKDNERQENVEKCTRSQDEDDEDESYLLQRAGRVSSSIVQAAAQKNPPPLILDVREEAVHRKRRRKVDLSANRKKARINVVEAPAANRTIRERLGRGEKREAKRRAPPASKAPGTDQEEALDARMKRIREQNEAILKRRQEIEMEEKRFRLT